MAMQQGNQPAPTGFRQYLRQTQNVDKQSRKAYNRDFRLLTALAVQNLGEDELSKLVDQAELGLSSMEAAHLRETAKLMEAWARQVLASEKVRQ